ncbi:(2Fe-2S) ferredoxin [Aliidongia dinghuensis]|uniref:(2Fe-2S) ferredoxin n=1 Tax=Aliidongia dinghuensis TaxID=1867774 RepID=A0A8J3E700_9PROT|nr:2Fe-2S iron-sulfur cluster-binding protein [Aliidongia dinghuensis]GGF49437.1 (2Fe-2S) ferredoxin [Aliidongia dinghuensis]
MAEVKFVAHDGSSKAIEVTPGISLMEAAVRNDVAGIDALCGGALACATCHIYIDPAWSERVGAATGDELEMLDNCQDVRPSSRLACQIAMREDLAGLVVEVPRSQSGV